MAATDFGGGVHALRLRVARLDSTGAPLVGVNAAYVTEALVKLDLNPVYADAEEIEEKNGSGVVCVTYKGPKTLKGYTVGITICAPDEQLEEILAGGTVLTETGTTTGYAVPAVGVEAAPNGLSIEAWSRVIVNGSMPATKPYRRWLLPRVKNLSRNDSALENAAHLPSFTGDAEENPNWGSGPFEDWPLASTRVLQRRRESVLPAASSDYVAVV